MSEILLATNNKGKLAELKRLLEPLGFELLAPADLGLHDAPEEDSADFFKNAFIKARYYSRLSGLPAIADDSGLCVDALDGAPGVRSARFAGEGATDESNNALLLEKLKSVPDGQRTARFCCAAVCVWHDGRSLAAEGITEGIILRAPRGKSGFGYDPLFFHPGLGKTFAEIDGAEKDAVSHRGRAFRALAEKIREIFVK